MTAEMPAVFARLDTLRHHMAEYRELREKLAILRHEHRAWADEMRTNRELLRALWRTINRSPKPVTDEQTWSPDL